MGVGKRQINFLWPQHQLTFARGFLSNQQPVCAWINQHVQQSEPERMCSAALGLLGRGSGEWECWQRAEVKSCPLGGVGAAACRTGGTGGLGAHSWLGGCQLWLWQPGRGRAGEGGSCSWLRLQVEQWHLGVGVSAHTFKAVWWY